MKIKKLTFVLENCEVIEIDGKYIGAFGVGKIKEYFKRIAINSFDAWKEAGEFWVEIHKDANNLEYKPFERLCKCFDICSIEIECSDVEYGDITYKYEIKWDDDIFSEENSLQDVKMALKNMYITENVRLQLNYAKNILMRNI